MEALTIQSEQTGFRLLDSITKVTEQQIHGEKTFHHAAGYLGLEAMAQLSALHTRRMTSFSRHAFLLKVVECSSPTTTPLQGKMVFRGGAHPSKQSSLHLSSSGP